jgi:hypothetical protein
MRTIMLAAALTMLAPLGASASPFTPPGDAATRRLSVYDDGGGCNSAFPLAGAMIGFAALPRRRRPTT